MRTWLIAVVAGVLGLVTGLLASRHSPGANPKPIPTQPEAALVSKIHPARKVVQSQPPALDAADFATQLRKLSSASWRRKWEQARDLADVRYSSGDREGLMRSIRDEAALSVNRNLEHTVKVEHSATAAMPEGGVTRKYGSTAITFYRNEA